MRYHLFPTVCIAAGCFFLTACPAMNDNGDGSAGFDGGADTTPATDGGLGCCSAGFSLYQCQQPGGGTGMACHNPALGCASSTTCGQGCDPQVSGRCACVQTQLCVVGDHFDQTLCTCVPNADAATSDVGRCIDTVLCIQGDHFDQTLCTCVPNADAATSDAGRCIDTVLCIQGDHFDQTLCKCVPDKAGDTCASAADCTGAVPALCQVCSDGSSGCAHYTCVAGACTLAYCP